MKNFLNQTWVTIVGWIGLIICAALLILGGTPAYCYKTGLRIDWDFICNQYKEKTK